VSAQCRQTSVTANVPASTQERLITPERRLQDAGLTGACRAPIRRSLVPWHARQGTLADCPFAREVQGPRSGDLAPPPGSVK
jgi:hypothetical protein